jgi:NAD(P)-dependent dehydrogenase (short-subunit alcohol dehydrogenase family)
VDETGGRDGAAPLNLVSSRPERARGDVTKTVLITGASSGIGRATAELMAKRGWQVAATSRDAEPLTTWAADHGISVFPLVDVADESAVDATVSAVVARHGTIDALVNNAGFGVFGPLEGAKPEDVELQFRINVLGTISLIRHVLPVMRSRRNGTIINVSSVGGRTASPFASLYHASKFAIEGLSESLRYEASLHGVRVKLIEPAHFRTGFISRSLRLVSHESYATQFDNYMEWVREEDRKAQGPEAVAEAILRAAEDPSPRLRYPVKGALMIALAGLLPDAMWRSLLGAGMTRRPNAADRAGGPTRA